MKLRLALFIPCVAIVILAVGLSTVPPASTPVVWAAAHSTVSHALTTTKAYTDYLPLILNCYPRQGPDPDLYLQYDMSLINADQTWGMCNINAGKVAIAIIDTGVDLTHPDLQANLLPGYDFVNGDNVPQDGNGHGSNVGGIAAAVLNGTGVAGVAPTAKILPVRVLNDQGSGYISDIADGIIYAADHAQVLNLSLGGVNSSQVLQDAIDYAVNTRGRLVVAAAGNCGDSNYPYNGCQAQNQTIYPAAYSNVVAVAATTPGDTHASFSNVGSYVDIAAPGSSIYNTYYKNSYAYESGTSQATPHVTGLAALIWAQHPGFTASQVWERITTTAVDLGAAGVDPVFGAGRIDVTQALSLATAQTTVLAPKPTKAEAAPVMEDRAAPIAPGRIIVKFKTTVNQAAVARALDSLTNTAVERSIPAIKGLVLRVPPGAEWKMIDRLRAQPDVEYAEPDYMLSLIP